MGRRGEGEALVGQGGGEGGYGWGRVWPVLSIEWNSPFIHSSWIWREKKSYSLSSLNAVSMRWILILFLYICCSIFQLSIQIIGQTIYIYIYICIYVYIYTCVKVLRILNVSFDLMFHFRLLLVFIFSFFHFPDVQNLVYEFEISTGIKSILLFCSPVSFAEIKRVSNSIICRQEFRQAL